MKTPTLSNRIGKDVRTVHTLLIPWFHKKKKKEAILSVLNGTDYHQHGLLPYALRDVNRLEQRNPHLTGLAYDWCSAIFENRQSLRCWEDLLLFSLEVGFRRFDVRDRHSANLTHTEHHLRMVDTIFKSQKSEAIADLLHAWITGGSHEAPTHTLLSLCTEHIMGLHDLIPSSPRLRSLVIRSIELMGYRGFEGVGVQRFIQMLEHLRVAPEDMNWKSLWLQLLLETLQTSEGVQLLPYHYWELLVEVAVSAAPLFGREIAYDHRVTTFLVETQEWSKLECWLGTIWMAWPPGTSGVTKEDLDRWMPLLFRQLPGAARKLEQWTERWCQKRDSEVLGSPRRDYKQAHEAIRRITS